jgi:ATP-dependent DNA ligase
MPLAVPLTLKPMEAEPVEQLPEGRQWLYEPKHDGFRCLAFRDGDSLHLQSRNQKPLGRYFPELDSAFRSLLALRFVIDGEIVIEGGSFETLQLRLHPAKSRIDKLAAEFPASFIAFDMLVDEDGADLTRMPFRDRRQALEAMVEAAGKTSALRISRATKSLKTAQRWLGAEGLDGIMAKDQDLPYLAGKRAMKKYKLWKTVDCVVAGLYRNDKSGLADSLLLGLHDKAGSLHYVGRIQVQRNAPEFTRAVQPFTDGEGFSGRAPGGPSRWTGKQREYEPLKPVLVAEVSADHVTGGQMRHGARFVRWRDDKNPRDCTLDQIEDWNSAPAL